MDIICLSIESNLGIMLIIIVLILIWIFLEVNVLKMNLIFSVLIYYY